MMEDHSPPRALYDAGMYESDVKADCMPYTMPGVLHYLQTECARMENQRCEWETERAELKTHIAFLEGERQGQENLKHDLVRRIKMLEYALKQERVQFHKFKSQIMDQPANTPSANDSDGQPTTDTQTSTLASANHTAQKLTPAELVQQCTQRSQEIDNKWVESRARLRKCLEEIGCTDNLLDLRQARVLNMMKSYPGWQQALNNAPVMSIPIESKCLHQPRPTDTSNALSSTQTQHIHKTDDFHTNATHQGPSANAELRDSPEPDSTGRLYGSLVDPSESGERQPKSRFRRTGGSGHSAAGEPAKSGSQDRLDRDLVENLPSSEFQNPLNQNEGMEESRVDNFTDFVKSLQDQTSPELKDSSTIQKPNGTQDDLCLAELATLTVNNEIEPSTDGDVNDRRIVVDEKTSELDANKSRLRTPRWNLRFTLRGHFDAIRSVAFHHSERAVFTASEDGCVMLWNLSERPGTSGLTPIDELEPVHVYCGHDGPVLCLTTPTSSLAPSIPAVAFSGGLDGTIRSWSLPSVCAGSGMIDLYSATPLESSSTVFRGSTAAVWSIAVHPFKPILMAAHADNVIEFWSLSDSSAPLRSIVLDDVVNSHDEETTNLGRATCVLFQTNVFYPQKASRCVVGTSTGWLIQLDSDTGQMTDKAAVVGEYKEESLLYPTDFNRFGINSAVNNFTNYSVYTAHDDGQVRSFRFGCEDVLTDSSMLHLDSTTCLALESGGREFITGGHDGSIRFWAASSGSCYQEITDHRVKNDECVNAVAFHPSFPLAASAGADGTCKIYCKSS